ncbi:BsuPI-related putative proteinase inhibitor [Desulfotruncus alcoholivorax]|uniref:BsuPI-related putative proteinase inhibitor n=1 Tax=Desulfotruncus alcoholivorax TaxID=265477 RepID=UPI0003FB8E1F|nr:BsuPI-related putative proteinase inhibitor [Desulfotruncus alcoholivorax]
MATTYRVRRGDTIYTIARQFGTGVSAILAANNIRNPNQIEVGDVLIIPTGGTAVPTTPGPGAGARNTRIFNGLRYTISTNRTQYRRGQQVRITFEKCNTSGRTLRLQYNTGQRVDFVALRGSREVWRWSDERTFTRATGVEVFSPGECKTYTATWDLRNKQGNYVALDNFRIRAYNVARNIENQYVETTIRVVPGQQPGPGPAPVEECPKKNMLRDPGFELWSDGKPDAWYSQNVFRTNQSHSGSYAAELGRSSDQQALLSQRIKAAPDRIYQVTFWARENVRSGGVSRFTMESQIYVYNSAGELIGRVDPVYTMDNIPNNTYQQFSFTSGVLPAGTSEVELRFIFRPNSNNSNTVKIDDVEVICVR